MIVYLREGWYAAQGRRQLRDAVIDGALDSASMFYLAGLRPEVLASMALKVHTITCLTLPSHRAVAAETPLSDRQRAAIAARLQLYTDHYPVLQGFFCDVLEHVQTAAELRALYLHLMHIAQAMQLLGAARRSVAAHGSLKEIVGEVAALADAKGRPEAARAKARLPHS